MSLLEQQCNLMFIAVPKCSGDEIGPAEFAKSSEVAQKIIAAEKSIRKHENVLYGGLFCKKNNYANRASQVLEESMREPIMPCDNLQEKIEIDMRMIKPIKVAPEGLIIIISDEETILEVTKGLPVVEKPYGKFLKAISIESN